MRALAADRRSGQIAYGDATAGVAERQVDKRVDGLDHAVVADGDGAAAGRVPRLHARQAVLRDDGVVLGDFQIENLALAQRQPGERRRVDLVGEAAERGHGLPRRVSDGIGGGGAQTQIAIDPKALDHEAGGSPLRRMRILLNMVAAALIAVRLYSGGGCLAHGLQAGCQKTAHNQSGRLCWRGAELSRDSSRSGRCWRRPPVLSALSTGGGASRTSEEAQANGKRALVNAVCLRWCAEAGMVAAEKQVCPLRAQRGRRSAP